MPKIITAYEDPLNPSCPKAGWYYYLESTIIGKAKKERSNSRRWKFREELDQMLPGLRAQLRFNEALSKEGPVDDIINNNFPRHLKQMKEEAEKKSYKSNWKNKFDIVPDVNEPFPIVKLSNGERWQMVPIEDSYDFLMKIHLEDNHCNGKLLLATIKRDRLCTFPRDILLVFNKYCPECRRETCSVTKEKIREEKKNSNVRNIIELVDVSDGDDVIEELTMPKLNVSAEMTIVFKVLHHPNWEPIQHAKYLLFGLVMESGYVLCKPTESMTSPSLLVDIASFLAASHIPNQIHFIFPLDVKDKNISEEEVSHCPSSKFS